MSWKLAVLGPTPDAMIENLSDTTTSPSKSMESPRIGFVFTGQGSQLAQMGKQLFHTYPAYARAITQADQILKTSVLIGRSSMNSRQPKEIRASTDLTSVSLRVQRCKSL